MLPRSWTLAVGAGQLKMQYEERFLSKHLGREPTFTELGLFSALWSEHCAYKHSRDLLGDVALQRQRILQFVVAPRQRP